MEIINMAIFKDIFRAILRFRSNRIRAKVDIRAMVKAYAGKTLFTIFETIFALCVSSYFIFTGSDIGADVSSV